VRPIRRAAARKVVTHAERTERERHATPALASGCCGSDAEAGGTRHMEVPGHSIAWFSAPVQMPGAFLLITQARRI
jgi:hypothetical protein